MGGGGRQSSPDSDGCIGPFPGTGRPSRVELRWLRWRSTDPGPDGRTLPGPDTLSGKQTGNKWGLQRASRSSDVFVMRKQVGNDHIYKYQWLDKCEDVTRGVLCTWCRCKLVYLRLGLTSLPDDNSGCSHGSALSYGAHQVCLSGRNYTKTM